MNDYKKIKVKLNDVLKEEPKQFKSTSVTLTKEQIEFIKDKNINLSELMRTILQDLISQDMES